ncbi:hypothetical protein ACQP1W_45835 [Spirillospora sp. CA-255316]
MAGRRALPTLLILLLFLTASACGDDGGALSTEPGRGGAGQAPGAPGGEAGGAGGGGGGTGGGGTAPGAPFKMPDINLNGKPIDEVMALVKADFRRKCRAAGRPDTCVTVVARRGGDQQYPDCIYLETVPPEGASVWPGGTVVLVTGGRPSEGDELCGGEPPPDESPPVTDPPVTEPPVTDPPVAPSGEPGS